MEFSSVKVDIMGHTYTIKGDASPEYIQELAEYINYKIEEIKAQNSSLTSVQAAILAALNITDEYFQTKNVKIQDEGLFEKKAELLISMLDEGLIGDVFSRTRVQ